MFLNVTKTGLFEATGVATTVELTGVVADWGVIRKGIEWREAVGMIVLEREEEVEGVLEDRSDDLVVSCVVEGENEGERVLEDLCVDVVISGVVEAAELDDCCSADTDEEVTCTGVLERLENVGSRRLWVSVCFLTFFGDDCLPDISCRIISPGNYPRCNTSTYSSQDENNEYRDRNVEPEPRDVRYPLLDPRSKSISSDTGQHRSRLVYWAWRGVFPYGSSIDPAVPSIDTRFCVRIEVEIRSFYVGVLHEWDSRLRTAMKAIFENLAFNNILQERWARSREYNLSPICH